VKISQIRIHIDTRIVFLFTSTLQSNEDTNDYRKLYHFNHSACNLLYICW